MLTIVSDLHIADKTTSQNVHASAFNLMQKMILDQIKRDDKEIHILLLGDVFDLVRTDYWLRNKIPLQNRPWSCKKSEKLNTETAMNPNDKMIEEQFTAILTAILATDEAIALREALKKIQKKKGKKDFIITYVVGNHDRVLNNFPALKQQIIDWLVAVGLPVPHFCHFLKDDKYDLLARHGHEWDKICHGFNFLNKISQKSHDFKRFDEECYQVMALGEVLTAELMSGLVYHTQKALDETDANHFFIDNFKELNNIRPQIYVFFWLEWLLNQTINEKIKQAVFDALKLSLQNFLDAQLTHSWKWLLELELKLVSWELNNTEKYDDISNFIKLIMPIINFVSNLSHQHLPEPLYNGAQQVFEDEVDKEFTKNIQYVVYGHTHQARHDYFDSLSPELNVTLMQKESVQLYINSGTFLPLISQTQNQKGFFEEYQMTLIFFHAGNENRKDRHQLDKNPTIDVWNGFKRKIYR